MERLTQERNDRTYKLFHLGWYLNTIIVVALLVMAAWQWGDGADRAIPMSLLVIATVLLSGAGVSRYQSRLEGQHLELKIAMNKLTKLLEDADSKKGG